MQKNQQQLALLALVAALALLGVVVVTVVAVTIPLQEAEAGCEKAPGGGISQAFNASKGRCFRP
jgi:hypothetical protein